MADNPWYLTAGIAVVSAVLTTAGSRYLEGFRARKATEKAEQDARRQYEFDARKRLYEQAEPLLFQLYEHAGFAVDRIEDLARGARSGKLREDKWLTDERAYYRPSTLYMLLMPAATLWLMRERLTFLDLSLDWALEVQYKLAYAANDAWSADFALRRQAPSLVYEPNDTQIWQGLLPGETQRPIRALIVGSGKDARLKTYAEFEDEYGRPNSKLNKEIEDYASLFDDFAPLERPVFWRVLVAQYFVCRALRDARDYFRRNRTIAPESHGTAIDSIFNDATRLREELLVVGDGDEAAELSASAIKIGKRFLAHTLRSDHPFPACDECRKCEGTTATAATAHGV
jgi:hypothetical protein